MSATKVSVEPEMTGADAPNQPVMGEDGNLEDSGRSNEQQQQQADRPEWLPPKFKTPQDLAKAYGELERKLGGGQQQPQQQQSQSPQQPEQPKSHKIEKPASKAEEDRFAKYRDEFATGGELSEDSYKELAEKHGLSRDVVDTYIAGQRLQAERQLEEFYGLVGGGESYAEMAEWARENLSEDEIASFNEAVTDPSAAAARWAIQGLKARFESANGSVPRTHLGGGRAGASVQPFRSMNELAAAQADPRYKAGDPDFHAEVDQRLSISKI